ncbi:immunoglobulin-like domain-containing protein [Listeria booriae]|uniref:immunoglobulin-like domain-containing protein n=1 Tax=Listeria booriae TaxID=1552123 RepID=UPI0016282F13|nr:immunoglobulin-like domain-containing protein [Listeria booriae]MBC1235453.1 DUF5011 domain-containing protein [Listeria booriae]MBC1248165.1 DUF5011 domain-containing protein [Listeria booriae]
MSEKNNTINKCVSATATVLLISSMIISPLSEINMEKVKAVSTQEAQTQVIALENGDFEDPVVTAKAHWDVFDENSVPGWNTTASDNLIEIQENGLSKSSPSISGNQWAELNANEVSALYQDVPTTPGVKVRWQVYHKGRHGVDTAVVEFGSPDGSMVQQAEMADDKDTWGLYTGEYTIPEDQTTTRFQFRSVSAAGGDPAAGNLLDNIQFATQSVLNIEGSFAKDGTKVKQGADYTLHVTNVGGMPADNNTISVQIPAELNYTAGSLSSANTTISNENYDVVTRTLTFKIDVLKKDATVDITIPMTGTTVTDAAKPSTSATYNDQNFSDTYTAAATDDAIAVTSNEPPAITGEAQTVVQPNTIFDPILTMAATDKEDGDLTNNIVVVSNPVDTSKSATYDVTYEVTDSDGNQATFTRHVIVAEAPVITGEAQTNVNPNSVFDPMSTMQAVDKEDGNLTDKLVIVSNNVNTSQPGTYEIAYKVTDSDGNTSTFQRTVTVTEIPVITTEDNVQIDRGTAFHPLDYVKANDKEDGDLTSQVKVTSNTVEINQAGTYHVTYEVTDSDGNKATKTMQVKVATVGTIKTNTFTITKDGYVTGTFAGDVARIAMIVDGQVYGKIPVPTDDTYKYYAGSKISSLSNHVEMVAYDTAGKELDRSDVTIQEVPPTVGDITATEYMIGSSYITGSYTGDVARISISINGDELQQIPASGSRYRYYVGSRVTSLDDKVEVIAYDAKGKELSRTNVSLEQDLPVGSIISNDYLVDGADKYMRGTVTGDITHVKLELNGTIMASPAFIQEDNSFQYYVGSHITSLDDKVVLVGYDSKGTEVSRTMINLKETQGTIATQDYLVGGADKYIRGTTTGDITHVKLEVNGTVMTSPALIQENNTFQYYTGSHITSTEDNAVLIGYNAQGKEISRKTISLIATQGTIAVEDYVVGGADKYIHGTSTGDVYRLKLIVNGETLSSKTYVQSGDIFNYYVASNEITSAENEKVEMVAYDNMGNELDRSIVNLR